MAKPYLTKSIYRELYDVEQIDDLLKYNGYVYLHRVGLISADDVVGLHGMVDGKWYSGTTIVLQATNVYYDKWGFPFYRFKRYTPPSKKTAYEKYKNPSLSWDFT